MPFKSRQQQKYMWSQHPEIARRWTNEGKGNVVANVPPWMQGKQDSNSKDDKKNHKRKAIQDRLKKIQGKDKKKSKAY